MQRYVQCFLGYIKPTTRLLMVLMWCCRLYTPMSIWHCSHFWEACFLIVLCASILGPSCKIQPFLITYFVDFLSCHDRAVVREALNECNSFSDNMFTNLICCRQRPTPQNLHTLLVQMAFLFMAFILVCLLISIFFGMGFQLSDSLLCIMH